MTNPFDRQPYYKAIDFWDSLWSVDADPDQLEGLETPSGGLIRDGQLYREAMDMRIAIWLAHPQWDPYLLDHLRDLYKAIKKRDKASKAA